MLDPNQIKQAVLQLTLAMTEAVSLPWRAVGFIMAAWAFSMHQVNEGTLTCGDSTGWAIIQLSALQIALVHPQLPS